MSLSTDQLLEWTKIITEKPETIITLGDDANYPLIKLAVEKNAPDYALRGVDQNILEQVYYDIYLPKAKQLMSKWYHEKPIWGLITVEEPSGNKAIIDSREIKEQEDLEMILSGKAIYDMRWSDLPERFKWYEFDKNRLGDYTREYFINNLLANHYKLSELNMTYKSDFVLVADAINNMFDMQVVNNLLSDFREDNPQGFKALVHVFEAWSATNDPLKCVLTDNAHYVGLDIDTSIWQRGWDEYLNYDNLAAVKLQRHRELVEKAVKKQDEEAETTTLGEEIKRTLDGPMDKIDVFTIGVFVGVGIMLLAYHFLG